MVYESRPTVGILCVSSSSLPDGKVYMLLIGTSSGSSSSTPRIAGNRSSVMVPRTVGFKVANLKGAERLEISPRHLCLDYGKLDRTNTEKMDARIRISGFPSTYDMVPIEPPVISPSSRRPPGPSGFEALLAFLGQTRGDGLTKGKRTSSRWLRTVESRAHQGDLQGGDTGPIPRGRGFGRGHRSLRADHPFYGRGEEVVRRAVLGSESVGDGPPWCPAP